LPIVAFTTRGPVEPSYFTTHRLTLQSQGATLTSLDKFGPLLNYVTPLVSESLMLDVFASAHT